MCGDGSCFVLHAPNLLTGSIALAEVARAVAVKLTLIVACVGRASDWSGSRSGGWTWSTAAATRSYPTLLSPGSARSISITAR